MPPDETEPLGFNIDIGDILRDAVTGPKRRTKRRTTTASASTSGMDAAVRRAIRVELADVERALRELAEEVVRLRRANERLADQVAKLDRADGPTARDAPPHELPDRPRPAAEKAFLVAVDTGDDDGWTAEESLAELANLATTAGAEVVGAEWQNRRHVDPNWYVGKGKAEELVARPRARPASTSSSPTTSCRPASRRRSRSLLNVKVIDRSRLILDIFAQHAQTHEGRLQVELAQLEYQLPRLTKLWTHLSRTQGGIGSRGPGESQLETDRRIIRDADQEDEGAGRAGPPAARRPRHAAATGG